MRRLWQLIGLHGTSIFPTRLIAADAEMDLIVVNELEGGGE